MKLTNIDQNDRTYRFYYAPYHFDGCGNITTNSAGSGENIDGYTVYEINKDGTVTALMDGEEDDIKQLALYLINRDLSDYSLQEAIADISLQISSAKFISIDSRIVIGLIIDWAKEFEDKYKGLEWGVDTDLDYMEAIEQFSLLKISNAITAELGYIDQE